MVVKERYFTPDMKVWTDLGAWSVEDLSSKGGKGHVTYDAFGNMAHVVVEEVASPMAITFLTLDTGQMIPVGVETQVTVVKPGDAKPALVRAADLTEGIHYVWMPSRKARLSGGMLEDGAILNTMSEDARLTYLRSMYKSFSEDNFRPDGYESMIYMEPPSFPAFRDAAEALGMYGCAVRARESDRRIEIDPRRPSCFATKLLTGRADDMEDFVNDLIDSHIINPVLPFNAMVDTAIKTGVICEGEGHEGLRTLLPTLNSGRKHKVYRVITDGVAETVDTPWLKF